jgi:hypothetical protein
MRVFLPPLQAFTHLPLPSLLAGRHHWAKPVLWHVTKEVEATCGMAASHGTDGVERIVRAPRGGEGGGGGE